MKKTFKDYLTEAPGDKSVKDWMNMGDPDKLSIEDKASSENLYGSGTSGKFDIQKAARSAKQRYVPSSMQQGYEQGPAINDVKIALERLQKLEDEFDGLAGQVAGGDGIEPDEIARELDGIRERVSAIVQTLNKAWKHLAIGSNKPYHG